MSRLFWMFVTCWWLVVAFWVVFVWKIGPTVVSLTNEHGVHTGDLLAVPAVLLAAWSLRCAVTGSGAIFPQR